MKALITAAACLLLCQPAQAFLQGPLNRGGGVHAGSPGYRHHGHGHGPGFGGLGFGGLDSGVPVYSAPEPPAEAPPPAPIVIAAPPPVCPSPVAAPREARGPHIIYIGHRPSIHGPKVVYGAP